MMASRTTHPLFDRLPRDRMPRALLALSFAATVAALPLRVHAQASSITGNQFSSATVETVDPVSGEVLLRDHTGGLITVRVPKGVHNLPHVQPGDQINVRFFQTIAAEIAPPGSPPPESTVSSARGLTNRHPHGMMVSFQRERVRVLAVDAPHDVVTFIDPSGITRTVTVKEKPIQALLATVKVGDAVDVTTADAVSFEVTNRVVTPSTTVIEGAATAGAGHPAGTTGPGPHP
jgi:hypothetical protein